MNFTQSSQVIQLSQEVVGIGPTPKDLGVLRVSNADRWSLIITVRHVLERPQTGIGSLVPAGEAIAGYSVRVREGRERGLHQWIYTRQPFDMRDLMFQSSATDIDVSIVVPSQGAGPFARSLIQAWVTMGAVTEHRLCTTLPVYVSLAAILASIGTGTRDLSIPPGTTSLEVALPSESIDLSAPPPFLVPYPPTLEVLQLDARGAVLASNTIATATLAPSFIPLAPAARYVGAIDPGIGITNGVIPASWIRHA